MAAKEVHPDTGSAREFWGAGQLQGNVVARPRGTLNESSHQHMEAGGRFLQKATSPKSKGAVGGDVLLCEMIYRTELILAWSTGPARA